MPNDCKDNYVNFYTIILSLPLINQKHNTMENKFELSQAWEHFWNEVKPGIWSGLDYKQKNRITTANRDYQGLRKNNTSGKVINLGPERIEKILSEFAPGLYRVEKTVVFYFDDNI